jgi:GNAT superfamily N-acetyltransferase
VIGLRRPTDSDVDALARIYIDSWNRGFGDLMGYRTHSRERRDRWQQEIHDPAVTWMVAEIGGDVVGFCGVGPSRDPVDPALGELQTIAVDPPSWRRGVGRVLMKDALGCLRLAYDSAILWTVAGYQRGHAFYGALGWTPLGWLRADGTETAFEHRLHEDDRT